MNVLLVHHDGTEEIRRGVSMNTIRFAHPAQGMGPVFYRTFDMAERNGEQFVVFREL